MKKFIKIIDLIIQLIFYILTIFLVVNIIKLSNIENLIRIIIIIILIALIPITYFLKKKKRILCIIILLILSIIFMFLNYTFYKVYSSLDNITVQVNTKVLCLVSSDEDIKKIKDITNSDIAILSSNNDSESYELAEFVLEDKNLKNRLVEYEDYIEIINGLLNGDIHYAFLPENYEDIYNASKEEREELDFNVLHTETKTIKKETSINKTQSLDKPFSILLIGTDVILDSYNADTLMLVTINPKTLKATMLSIPRDTYTTIACTGGKHKINASGWYGDSCVVKTVEKYLDIKIDYYAKMNFLGVVDLVNKLGGVDVEVPYSLCEQNSAREFGDKMIYVDEGKQTLNGEQALALSRNRHYWDGMCPEKYTKDGDRNDITRGQNQQLVIKSIINKMMTIKDVNTFYGILDTIGNNMTTNMPKDTILSFYNIGKDIIKKLNKNTTEEVIGIERLTFKSHSATVLISGLDLSVIVNYNESVDYISKQMKKNLGLIKTEPIKNFSFDINEPDKTNEVKFKTLTSNLKTLPNFVGKTLREANGYCNSHNLKCEINQDNLNATITSQSIGANSDISTIRNKTIIFEVEVIEKQKKPTIDKEIDDETKVEKEEDKITENNPIDKNDKEEIPEDNIEEDKENKEDLNETEQE